jgi:hypothetical protein
MSRRSKEEVESKMTSLQTILDYSNGTLEDESAMKCEFYTNERGRSVSDKCGEQATMLWISTRYQLPVPCCAYHAQDCPDGEIVSLARPEAAYDVTFLRYEAHA